MLIEKYLEQIEPSEVFNLLDHFQQRRKHLYKMGTAVFISYAAAIDYYHSQGYGETKNDTMDIVKQKLTDFEICISENLPSPTAVISIEGRCVGQFERS